MKLSRAAAIVGVGAVVIGSASLVRWASATIDDDLRGPLEVTAVGSAVAPAMVPIAAAAIAALGALLATRGVLRRIVGVLIAVLGVAICWLGVRGLLHQPVDVLLANSPTAVAASVRISVIGPILALLGGVCLLLAAVPIAAGRIAARSLGARYERRATAAETAATSADPNLVMWKELDESRDPTLSPTASPILSPTLSSTPESTPPVGRVRLDRAPEVDDPNGKAAL